MVSSQALLHQHSHTDDVAKYLRSNILTEIIVNSAVFFLTNSTALLLLADYQFFTTFFLPKLFCLTYSFRCVIICSLSNRLFAWLISTNPFVVVKFPFIKYVGNWEVSCGKDFWIATHALWVHIRLPLRSRCRFGHSRVAISYANSVATRKTGSVCLYL